MPDNTNVNNNASVVVVGRTAPVPPGQQKSDKAVPAAVTTSVAVIPLQVRAPLIAVVSVPIAHFWISAAKYFVTAPWLDFDAFIFALLV